MTVLQEITEVHPKHALYEVRCFDISVTRNAAVYRDLLGCDLFSGPCQWCPKFLLDGGDTKAFMAALLGFRL